MTEIHLKMNDVVGVNYGMIACADRFTGIRENASVIFTNFVCASCYEPLYH